MTNPTTSSSPPVELPLRLEACPEPVPDCDVCSALASERNEAHARRDMSKVSDVNVEIRRHPHKKGRRS
ncbi:hypothetical protein M8I34_01300 [Streptomyces sp. MCA2]|uniref:hypothetical protein n=1 Tax=Streptomyces TaxID=1883 RepID=UPI0020213DBC|nr:hypothetical protein [Streptomyces sp. MCA2]MCL7490103.1 hypothetical protein [Streptomyces sp. MCA2]